MLLTEAGITASPVLLSTRDNGIHPGLPMLSVFNNVIVLAGSVTNKYFWMPLIRTIFLGLFHTIDLSHEGFQVDLAQENGKWVSLDDNNLSRKVITYCIIADG